MNIGSYPATAGNVVVDTTSMANYAKSLRKNWRKITGNVRAQIFTTNSNLGSRGGKWKFRTWKARNKAFVVAAFLIKTRLVLEGTSFHPQNESKN